MQNRLAVASCSEPVVSVWDLVGCLTHRLIGRWAPSLSVSAKGRTTVTGEKPAMGRQRGLAVDHELGDPQGVGVCAEQAQHLACSGTWTDAHYFLLSRCSAGASVQNSVVPRYTSHEASASVHVGQA